MTNINHTKDTGKRELCLEDMIKGIGRKATDEELIEYLSKEVNISAISINSAFRNYLNQK